MNSIQNNINGILSNPASLFSVRTYREDINFFQEDVISSLYELTPGRPGLVVKTGRSVTIN